ncbi:hypothetical protein KAFR_0A08410 [Kazachstania africana CBS 2517]|uniref:Uncharacterized protein n=1 Tax=Kazachstania africana (strain ATCC 22294 / BCRC 22015 / CBS 2517 / CECT 1963 / NBRC 1671 / NRRL Y-8276) TaxID=1071382 RepID=H2APH5_KAZAF|nr:hypothetical protein KAFR_0A08410 [Kazachstania africana CBS 2517]CCF56275.1 hypothetical protein KAFR_0A08410 [Kazachstania africana CBS 2517]
MSHAESAPPPYQEHDTSNGVFIPDDFKYSTKVISCEPQVRAEFQSKVYSILSSQLLCTFAVSYYVSNSTSAQNFIFNHMFLWFFAAIFSVVSCVWLSLSPRAEDYSNEMDSEPLLNNNDNHVPWYILSRKQQRILLGLFTLAESYMISMVTLTYNPDIVLRALVVTTVIVIGVTAMAVSGKFDLALESVTTIYIWLSWAVLLLIGIGISSLIFGMSEKWDLIYGWLGAIVFTIYLFIDTQLIFRKVYFDEEIKCAMMLYLDIINLFLSILRIMSHNSDD